MFATFSVLALVACSASASLIGINPNALNVPLDEAKVAIEKNHQLIQQASEGTRNILGGGVPLALPADTHEVAAGKRAHAVAHATQAALTTGHGSAVWGAPAAAIAAAPAAVLAAPRLGLGLGAIEAGPRVGLGLGLGLGLGAIDGRLALGHGIVESAPLGLALSRPGPLHLAAPHGIDSLGVRGLGLGLGHW